MLKKLTITVAFLVASTAASAKTITEYYDVSSYSPTGHSLYINTVKYDFNLGASFARYDDDTGALTGTAVDGSGDGFDVSLSFANFRDWTAQSAAGLDGKTGGGGDKTTWTYMDMVDVSTLTGIGALAGNNYELLMKPQNGPYTFQYGVGANDKNANLGLSGWFFTKNGAGAPGAPCGSGSTCDFNLNMAVAPPPGPNPVPLPAGIVLLPLGLGALAALRRRKSKVAA